MIERLQNHSRLKRGFVIFGFGGSLAIAGCAATEAAPTPPDTAHTQSAQAHERQAVAIHNETQSLEATLRASLVQAEREQAARNALRLANAIPTPAPTEIHTPPSPTSLPRPRPTHPQTVRPTTEAPALAVTPQNLSANALLAEQMAASRGWTGQQWICINELWTEESHFDTYAYNGSSGAYGIPQSDPGNKMASAGSDWRTNPATQITWGLDYIAGRYGTPCNAESYHLVHNSY